VIGWRWLEVSQERLIRVDVVFDVDADMLNKSSGPYVGASSMLKSEE